MKYLDGQKVKIGDQVRLGSDLTGIVVAVIDDDQYSDPYPREDWSYLKVGALVESIEGGLFHFPNAITDFELIK